MKRSKEEEERRRRKGKPYFLTESYFLQKHFLSGHPMEVN